MLEYNREAAREARRRRIRRERMIGAGTLIAVVLGAGVMLWPHGSQTRTTSVAVQHKKAPPPQLPRGGREILPDFRVVAYDGAPNAPLLGPLGADNIDVAAAKLNQQAEAFDTPKRPMLPAFELIATLAQRDAGDDGNYNGRLDDATIGRYLAAARRAKALLILDIQPGQSSFMTEVQHYGHWLEQPDVGIALDPEWSMAPGEVPGTVIGSTTAAVVNQVAHYVAGYVKRGNLPQKLLIVHQFTSDMINNRGQLQAVPGIAEAVTVDGFGGRAAKLSKYHLFARTRPDRFNGLKLFYTQDTNLMKPAEVMHLHPSPDVIVYQ
jgi:hypothetical protein